MQAAKKVIINTSFLYGRMIISMIITLYSTRLILNSLGAEDYGIFNVVGGVIAMLAFLNAAMQVSTQRYLSYNMSRDKHLLSNIFQTSVFLHLVIGIIIIITLEVIGLFLFDGFLNINLERITAAKIIYQFMIVSLFFTINAVPYDALINSHEDLFFDAIIGIIDALFKLIIAIYLTFSTSDKLITFGLLTAISVIIIRSSKSYFCHLRYPEAKFSIRFSFKRQLIKEMASFAGWNLFGSIASLVKTQGLAIVINLFFGALANAAFSISNQINAQLSSISENMLKSIRPQIVKSEGDNNRQRMLRLTLIASKYSFYLISFITIPILICMPRMLELWLKNVPEYTVIFCRLLLISNLINSLTNGIRTAVLSIGNIKNYQFVVGSLLILNLPISYLILSFGAKAYWIYLVSIFIEFITLGFRIYFLKHLTSFPIKTYLTQTVLKATLPAILITILLIFISQTIMEDNIKLLIIIICHFTFYPILIFFIGSNSSEKDMAYQITKKLRSFIIR